VCYVRDTRASRRARVIISPLDFLIPPFTHSLPPFFANLLAVSRCIMMPPPLLLLLISAPGYRARFVQRARCNASNAFHSAIDPPSSFRLSVARWHSFLLRRRRRCDVTTPTMRRCNRDFLSFPAQWNARRQFRT